MRIRETRRRLQFCRVFSRSRRSRYLLRDRPLTRLHYRAGSPVPRHTRCPAGLAWQGSQVCDSRRGTPFAISEPPQACLILALEKRKPSMQSCNRCSLLPCTDCDDDKEGSMVRERALKAVLVVVGLLFTAGVVPLTMFFSREPSVPMLMSIYVTLGIFLLLAVRDPAANRSLIALRRMGKSCACW